MKHNKRPRKKAKKRRGRGRGLSGANEEAKKALQQDSTPGPLKPLAMVAGFFAGSLIGKGVDKIEALKPDEEAEGFQIKSLIKPAIIGAAGAVAHIGGNAIDKGKSKVSIAGSLAKNFGFGLYAAGATSLVKRTLKFDLSEGLGKPAELDAGYYEEAKESLAKLLNENNYTPQLLDAGTVTDEGTEMQGTRPGYSDLQMTNMSELL